MKLKEIVIQMPDNVFKALEMESKFSGVTIDSLIESKIEQTTNLGDYRTNYFEELSNLNHFLSKIPSVESLDCINEAGKYWWIKLKLDIKHNLAWTVVQELGHILNYLSVEERLPIKFFPVSPPPYLNGGPDEYLTWIIEPDIPYLSPAYILDYLEGRLPEPIDDINEWID